MSLMPVNRRFAISALALGLSSTALPAFAEEQVSFNTTYGLALRGFDPVAYFRVNKALKGLPNITASHEGRLYEFSSEENKALFIADPQKYVPQYGGFCAYAAANGYKADVDPHAFAINDGKLYVNFSEYFRDEFQKDASGNVAKANANWSAKVRDMKEVLR